MCLPSDETELRRWAEFVVSRWTLEHHVYLSCVQAMCLGMPIKPRDFMKIVRAYVDARTENKKPQAGPVDWK